MRKLDQQKRNELRNKFLELGHEHIDFIDFIEQVEALPESKTTKIITNPTKYNESLNHLTELARQFKQELAICGEAETQNLVSRLSIELNTTEAAVSNIFFDREWSIFARIKRATARPETKAGQGSVNTRKSEEVSKSLESIVRVYFQIVNQKPEVKEASTFTAPCDLLLPDLKKKAISNHLKRVLETAKYHSGQWYIPESGSYSFVLKVTDGSIPELGEISETKT